MQEVRNELVAQLNGLTDDMIDFTPDIKAIETIGPCYYILLT